MSKFISLTGFSLYLLSLPILVQNGFAAESKGGQDDEIIAVGQWIGGSQPDDLASPVSVLTQAEIENRGQIYVGQLLRALPGIAVSHSGGAGSKTQIRLRGAEANHVLVLIDGVKMANPSDGEFDFAGLDAANIVKIEVLRGEQSALYGSDAIGGVINITTRSQETRPSWLGFVEAGSFETLTGGVSAVLPVKSAALSISAGALQSAGYDVSNLNGEEEGEKDGHQSRNINIGLTNINLGGLALSGRYGRRLSKAGYDSDVDGDGWLDNASNDSLVDNQTHQVGAEFSYMGLDHKLSYFGHHIRSENRGSFQSVSKGFNDQLRWAARTQRGAHGFSVLGEGGRETYEIAPSFALVPTRPETESYAVAGDYRYAGEALFLTASARGDFNDRFGDSATWKLGGVYKLSKESLLRASLGTGIKNPTMIELFGFFPDSNFQGNSGLKPETSFGVNAGYQHVFLGGDLTASLDYFASRLEDKITGSGNSVTNQAGRSRREGLEFALNWAVSSDVDMQASITTLKAKDAAGEAEIRRPDHTASLSGTWQLSDKLLVGGSLDYNGEQLDDRFFFDPSLGQFGSYVSERLTLEAFTLLSASLAYDINDALTLTLRGENLLDETYQEVVGYASQGRGIYAGLRARFD